MQTVWIASLSPPRYFREQSRTHCCWDIEATARGARCSQPLIPGLVKLPCLLRWWTGFGEKINGLGAALRLTPVKLLSFFNFVYNYSILEVMGGNTGIGLHDWVSLSSWFLPSSLFVLFKIHNMDSCYWNSAKHLETKIKVPLTVPACICIHRYTQMQLWLKKKRLYS